MTNNFPDNVALRRHWMGVLANAPGKALEQAWEALAEKPGYALLRPPQTGLAMVRSRIGGTGRRFNLGEMTLTRCAVTTDHGIMGLGYVAGRDAKKAELAAVFDALLQDDARREALLASVIVPLKQDRQERRQRVLNEAAPSKVDFFTLVRGED